MSLDLIRQMLETRLAALTPVGLDATGLAITNAFENADFSPTIDAPFQEVRLLPAVPDNPVYGAGFVERGIFQITLSYPVRKGSKAAVAQAEAIRAWFPRGSSLVKGGLTLTVEATPEIAQGSVPSNMYEVPVRVRWYANVGL